MLNISQSFRIMSDLKAMEYPTLKVSILINFLLLVEFYNMTRLNQIHRTPNVLRRNFKPHAKTQFELHTLDFQSIKISKISPNETIISKLRTFRWFGHFFLVFFYCCKMSLFKHGMHLDLSTESFSIDFYQAKKENVKKHNANWMLIDVCFCVKLKFKNYSCKHLIDKQ